MLKHWRNLRKRSQLDLALDAGVSQRHLSFLESGRARPSREMVLQLAEVLEVPLRERNQLLHAAGFASIYQERGLDHEDMRLVHDALALTLHHHEPYPAMVVDRAWNMLMCNEPTRRFIAALGDYEEVWRRVDPSGQHNIVRLTFHPHGLQPLVRNWSMVAATLMARLQRELAADPTNEELRSLSADVEACPTAAGMQAVDPTKVPGLTLPVFPVEYEVPGQGVLKVFSMISSFGTALDVTADELRIETFFPADDFSKAFFEMLATPNDAPLGRT